MDYHGKILWTLQLSFLIRGCIGFTIFIHVNYFSFASASCRSCVKRGRHRHSTSGIVNRNVFVFAFFQGFGIGVSFFSRYFLRFIYFCCVCIASIWATQIVTFVQQQFGIRWNDDRSQLIRRLPCFGNEEIPFLGDTSLTNLNLMPVHFNKRRLRLYRIDVAFESCINACATINLNCCASIFDLTQIYIVHRVFALQGQRFHWQVEKS